MALLVCLWVASGCGADGESRARVASGEPCRATDLGVASARCTNPGSVPEVTVACVCDLGGAWQCPTLPADGDPCFEADGTSCAFEGPPPGCPTPGNANAGCQCVGDRWQCTMRCWSTCPVVFRTSLDGQPCDFKEACFYVGRTCRCGSDGTITCAS
jgi:hypothetical protein